MECMLNLGFSGKEIRDGRISLGKLRELTTRGGMFRVSRKSDHQVTRMVKCSFCCLEVYANYKLQCVAAFFVARQWPGPLGNNARLK